LGCPLPFYFHFVVTPKSSCSIAPRARRQRKMVFSAEALLIETMLPIIGGYHLRKIGIVKVPAMEFVGYCCPGAV
jgi:hypothetical protein